MGDLDGTRAIVVTVGEDGTEVPLTTVEAGGCGLELVDALLRLRLAACRRGHRLLLRDVPEELGGLLELVGVAGLLGLEVRRQPELREELGVDEVVEPRDPPA